MTTLNQSLVLWLLLAPFAAALLAGTLARAEGDGEHPQNSFPAREPDPAAVERVAKIQAALREAGVEAWLFYDFHGSNPLARSVLLVPDGAMSSRRWFYFVPAQGEPVKIVHAIESANLDHLPGIKRIYAAWSQLAVVLRDTLKGKGRVAMEYSAEAAIPTVSRVDAGTIEMVRKAGGTVVSSGDLLQKFEAVWTAQQREQHDRAAVAIRAIVDEAWKVIARRFRAGAGLDERTLQQHMSQRMTEMGLETDHPPIVAVGPNAADPHYDPPEEGSAPIREGDLVLLDIWGKVKEPGAVYADITWMGVVAETVPERYDRVWKIARQARDAALEFVRTSVRAGTYPAGWQVDDASRGVIFQAGFGPDFPHRTGHSIHTEVHGNGANLDNLETHDERKLVPGTCFSIEPGIYLKGDFGIRTEIDVCLDGRDAVVTGGPPQEAIVPILTLAAKR